MDSKSNATEFLPAVTLENRTLGPVASAAQRYVDMAQAANTTRAYQSDWAHFTSWCAEQRLRSFPCEPTTVGLYIASMAEAGYKVSTITRRLAAISKAHRDQGRYNPASLKYSAVVEVLKGVKREKGTRPDAKAALTIDGLRAMVLGLEASPRGLRDQALLLIGFGGGFRRSELAALNVADVEETEDGLKVTIRRAKNDQEGAGRTLGIPFGSNPRTCPVRSLRRWLAASGITEGAIFRRFYDQKIGAKAITAHAVAKIVKRSAERAGIDSVELSGHSLRSGMCTTAARGGASERSIMRQSGHKSVQMVRRYIHEADIWTDNAGMKLGL